VALDPELQVFEHFTLPDFADIPAVREWERALAASAPAIDSALSGNIRLDDFTLPGPAGTALPVRLYRPAVATALPVLLYFHGGSFVMGGLDTDHRACLEYASGAHCAVLSVDYRLAPEHPFPAALEDGYSAWQWLIDNGQQWGLDSGRIALGGSSSGATLAAGLAIMMRDKQPALPFPAPLYQMLVHPALDDRMLSGSINSTDRDYGVNHDVVSWMWRHYLGENTAGTGKPISAWAAPARIEAIQGLPSAYIETAELDPLRDEVLDYAARLLRAGVSVDFHLFAAAPHAFDMVATASVTRQAFSSRCHALRKGFGRQ